MHFVHGKFQKLNSIKLKLYIWYTLFVDSCTEKLNHYYNLQPQKITVLSG